MSLHRNVPVHFLAAPYRSTQSPAPPLSAHHPNQPAMASIRGQILYYLTALGAYRLRRRGEEYYIKLVSDIWKKQAEPAVVPSSMMGDPKLDITEWLSGEEGRSDRWQIFTIKPKVIKRKRLVVYFHGGAFCLAVSANGHVASLRAHAPDRIGPPRGVGHIECHCSSWLPGRLPNMDPGAKQLFPTVRRNGC